MHPQGLSAHHSIMHTPVNAQHAPHFYRNFQQPNAYLNDSKDQLYHPAQLNYTQSLLSHQSESAVSSKFVSPDLEAKQPGDEIKYEGDIAAANVKSQPELNAQENEAALQRYHSQSSALAGHPQDQLRGQRSQEVVPKAFSSFSEHAQLPL
jgi:hypothetical protein